MKYYKAVFLYRGKKELLIIKALNKSTAIIQSKQLHKGLLVDIYEISIPFEEKVKIFKDIIFKKILIKTLNYPVYISSLNQLSVLLKSGISLKDALEDISNNTQDKLIKNIFFKSAEAIDSGKNLSDVFLEYENYTGKISVAMIKLGEQTGDLVNALETLTKIYKNIYENRNNMKKALRYPFITLLAIAGAFTFLVLVVVPKFKMIFSSLNANLPLPTIILLKTEFILSHYGLLILVGLLLFIVLNIYLYKISYNIKYKLDTFLLKIYLVKNIIEYSTLSRTLSSLAFLIRSGIPLVDALSIIEKIVENEVIKEKMRHIIKGINQGRALSEMVKENNLVNYVALRMISAGEDSGELDEMLKNASNYYEDKFQNIIDNLQASLEPVMMLIIGGLILWLALGIFMPMWNLANAIKGGG